MQSLYKENVKNRDLVVQVLVNTKRNMWNTFSAAPTQIDYYPREDETIGSLDATVESMEFEL